MTDAIAPNQWVCPECHCLLSVPTIDACPLCNESLAWIDPARHGRFREALATSGHPGRQIASRDVRLIIEVRFGKERSRVVGYIDQEASITILGKTFVVRPIVNEGGASSVEIASGTKSSVVQLPGHRILQRELHFTIWQQVSVPEGQYERLRIQAPVCGQVDCNGYAERTFGRVSAESQISLLHPDVDLIHFVIAKNDRTSKSHASAEFWIADWQSEGMTFVDGKPILVKKLIGGELIQAGPYAFLFTCDGRLLPQNGIDGFGVEVEAGFCVSGVSRNRLSVEEALTIPPGQFIGIVGKSGAGKSTLLKAIARLPSARGIGGLRFDGTDFDAPNRLRPAPFARSLLRRITESPPEQTIRGALGYLSQDSFVHLALTPLQVLAFVASLRCPERNLKNCDFENVLGELGIPPKRQSDLLSKLSGGEQKRVRIAGELLAAPRLFLLDEPASGLDPEREAIVMRSLRNLSLRGCTVAIVTHSRDASEYCDRVIEVDESGTVRTGQLRDAVVSVALAADQCRSGQTDLATVKGLEEGNNAAPASPVSRAVGSMPSRGHRQWTALINREFALQRNDWFRRVLVPLAVPCFFACALSIAIPSDSLERLGFFCVLTAIWMGASLSLLSIVDEREVFDHESFLYLRTGPYLGAKLAVFSLMAVLQTLVFVVCFVATRAILSRDVFEGVLLWFPLIFFVLEISGVALGLFLSVIAGRSRYVANLLLPLAMIAQIVFSALAAGATGPVEEAYSTFHVNKCAVWPDSWATKWLPYSKSTWSGGVWLSENALDALPTLGVERDAEFYRKVNDDIAEIRRKANEGAKDGNGPPILRPKMTEGRPAAWISYLLASRYGDILVRTCLNSTTSSQRRQAEFGYAVWTREAFAGLIWIIVVFMVLTFLLLNLPESAALSLCLPANRAICPTVQAQ